MHARHRSRFRGRNLPSTFAQEMAFYGASDAWDFTTQTYIRGGVLAPSGITFTRASVGSYLNSNNTMTVFSSGQPRIGDKGLLIEGSRQNLFLNSAVGATQSITVTAAAHTLSFYGTGTVTLSGVSTAGPLVGTGEFNRVSLTFTPTAGSLTLTVSGDIKWVNLELGSFPSSWIPTEGTAVTRAADTATAAFSSLAYPLTLFTQFSRAVDTGATDRILYLYVTNFNNRATINVDASDRAAASMDASGVTQANLNVTGALTVGVSYKVAARFNTDSVRMARSGTLSAEDTSATLPTNPTTLIFGNNETGNAPGYAYMQNVAVIPKIFTDSELQMVTT